MRASILAGLWLSGAAVILASCNDHASPTSESGATSSSPIALAAGGTGCSQGKGHPAGTIVNTVTASFPWGVAVRDDGLAYFTQILDGGVGITSTTSQQVTGFIPTGYLPTGVAFSPDGSRAYVANQGDNTVTAINVASSQVIGSISTGGSSPFSVQVSPDGTQLYVGNNDNTLLIVDTGSLTISKTVIVGFATNAFTVDGAGRMLYASSFASGQVTELDIFTGNVVRTFDVGGTPQGLAINRKGTHLYVANEAGYLNDIDLFTGQIGTQIPLVGGGFGVGVTPDDHEAWIAIPFSGKVQIFNLQLRRITGSLDVGGEPRRIAFSDQGKIGAVTNIAGYLTFVK
jgi:YVTN family beta-propeller protein